MRETLQQTVDYADFLRTLVVDLAGGASLAYELIQNADDAPHVTELIFDFQPDRLRIENNASFRKEDFNRLLHLAGGGKRSEEGTIGSFGIGFNAVYHVTDHPVIRSLGKKWTFFPERSGEVDSEDISDNGRTTFDLPWARDDSSEVRHLLQQPAVTEGRIGELQKEIFDSLPLALLFLRKLAHIELRVGGERIARVSRSCSGSLVNISIDSEVKGYMVLEGNFSPEADALRAQYSSVIEAKRRARTSVAVSSSLSPTAGRVFAYLPTEMPSGIPAHLNADFFPRANRRNIDLESPGKAEWNKAALESMARCIGEKLVEVRDALGAQQVLQFLGAIREAHGDIGPAKPAGQFWSILGDAVRSSSVVAGQDGSWYRPDETCFPVRGEDEYECAECLRALDLHLIEKGLRPHQNLLTSKDLGSRLLNLKLLVEKLGEKERRAMVCEDEVLQSQLAKLVGVLRELDPKNLSVLEELKGVPMVWAADATLRPPRELVQLEKSLAQLFQGLGLESQLADPRTPSELMALCCQLSIPSMIELLANVASERWNELWEKRPEEVIGLHRWFADQGAVLRADPEIAARLRALRIWPSAGHLRALDDLVVPGGFSDPLGLTAVLDVAALDGSGELYEKVGARKLTIQSFSADHVPRALRETRNLSAEARRQVVALLAKHRSEIVDDRHAQRELADCALVECTDGRFRKAPEVYFESLEVRAVLGEMAPTVTVDRLTSPSVHELYMWLGVASRPMSEDVVTRVAELVSRPPSSESIAAVSRIVRYLGESWRLRGSADGSLGGLKVKAWLPKRGDHSKWWSPGDMFATYQSHLFLTSGEFLDLEQVLQKESSDLLEWLGVQSRPTVPKVVAHLRNCIKAGAEVHPQVYEFLDQNRGEPYVIDLKRQPCIWVKNQGYLRPDQVFWQDVTLGAYAVRLSPDFRKYGGVLAAWGVRETPSPVDGQRVLDRIFSDFGLKNTELPAQVEQVAWECWRLLATSPDSTEVDWERLKETRVIPNRHHLLVEPRFTYIDDRPGLAAKFMGRLDHDVIDKRESLPALVRAGVRSLSEQVSGVILEIEEEDDAADLMHLMVVHRNSFLRVFAATSTDFEALAEKAIGLRIQYAARLMVEYHVTPYDREFSSTPEAPDAFFDKERKRLLVLRAKDPPLASISRELAIWLVPSLDPGGMAAAMTVVLNAGSPAKAEELLDSLGYARVRESSAAPSSPEVEPWPPGADDVADQWRKGDETGSGSGSEGDAGAARDKRGPAEGQRKPGNSGERTRSPESVGTRVRLRSYVSNSQAPDVSGGAARDDSLEVDRRGVDFVVETLEEEGWHAREMTHNNPGYDVLARRDGSAEIYIEVKSISGPWDQLGVGLSKWQYDFAREKGEACWLYIVEDVFRSPKIHRIQDPAGRVTHYHFDDGWKVVGNPQAAESRRRSILDLKAAPRSSEDGEQGPAQDGGPVKP
jgi:uncharacterized protein DUF3883